MKQRIFIYALRACAALAVADAQAQQPGYTSGDNPYAPGGIYDPYAYMHKQDAAIAGKSIGSSSSPGGKSLGVSAGGWRRGGLGSDSGGLGSMYDRTPQTSAADSLNRSPNHRARLADPKCANQSRAIAQSACKHTSLSTNQ